MENRYSMIVNDGIFFEKKNIFSYEELKSIIENYLKNRGEEGVEFEILGEVDRLSVEDMMKLLMEYGEVGEVVKCFNLFIGYGDDYSEVSIVKME